MAISTKAGTFVVPTTNGADVVIPNPGFVSKIIFLSYGGSGTDNTLSAGARYGFGVATGPSNQWTIAAASDQPSDPSNAGGYFRNNACLIGPATGTPSIEFILTLTAFNADGTVTLNAPDGASIAGLPATYFLIGGADITDALATTFKPATSSPQTVTVGFDADFALFGHRGTINLTNGIVDAYCAVGGAARASSNRFEFATLEDDAAATMNVGTDSDTLACITMLGPTTPVVEANGNITSWPANGITITWTDLPASATKDIGALFVKGGSWHVLMDTKPSGNVTKTHTGGLTFIPKGVMAFGNGRTASGFSAAIADSQFLSGFADGTASVSSGWFQRDAATASASRKHRSTTRAIRFVAGSTPVDAGNASVGSFTANQFQSVWLNSNTSLYQIGFVVVGDGVITAVPLGTALNTDTAWPGATPQGGELNTATFGATTRGAALSTDNFPP
jgi:hypothetical protein